MKTVDPLIKSITELIDSRFKTFYITIRSEIRASEERVIARLEKKIVESEKRLEKRIDGIDARLDDQEKSVNQLKDQVMPIKPKN